MPTRLIESSVLVSSILDGLRKGLSRFNRQPTRVATIYRTEPTDQLVVYDPENLLQPLRDQLKEYYRDETRWLVYQCLQEYGWYPIRNSGITGLVTSGAQTTSINYQMWFAEQAPDALSTKPIACWLARAASLFNKEITSTSLLDWSQAHRTAIEHCGILAIDGSIKWLYDERQVKRPDLPLVKCLETILEISVLREEGHLPEGTIAFVPREEIRPADNLVMFDYKPEITQTKHIRKLLTIAGSEPWHLVSDGHRLIGVGKGAIPQSSLIARFRGERGKLSLGAELICVFEAGSFHSSGGKAAVAQFNEKLGDLLNSNHAQILREIVNSLVQSARQKRHGCSLVLDLGDKPITLTGQALEAPLPITRENLPLIQSMSAIDGALHIDSAGTLHAFGCLLDGPTVPVKENPARGARYNSAVRFTHAHPRALVITVSEDGPVAVFIDGKSLNTQAEVMEGERFVGTPPTLDVWLSGNEPIAVS